MKNPTRQPKRKLKVDGERFKQYRWQGHRTGPLLRGVPQGEQICYHLTANNWLRCLRAATAEQRTEFRIILEDFERELFSKKKPKLSMANSRSRD